MASVMRYMGGDTKPRLFKTSASYPIEEGDLVYVERGVAYPASVLADAGTAVQNQDAFAAIFAGVAMAKNGLQTGEFSFHRTTDLGYITVATAGLWRYPCASYQWSPEEEVGVYADADGCYDQQVAPAVTVQAGAIGLAVLGIGGLTNALTEVTVDIRSRIAHSGVQETGSGQ